MPDEKTGDTGPQGNGPSEDKALPEALATFAATARSEAKVSPDGGLSATPETSALPGDLSMQHDAATKVLREGVLREDQGAEAAVDRLPDRARAR